ncbi:ABC transporter ATP-binding protein [Spiroplasma corruscae]|uniref:ABC transporter ATP-binding protein n=1 Tax=Spiroplasma corruscae TaxID=216934 RepID=A0A222EPS1_9MOLU|nr:ABC transporter ATP-binding protein [Spiroplasma corruscae]ASP28293.1 ABC transporter ATP-binding protein [Spiroplasma corruscae]
MIEVKNLTKVYKKNKKNILNNISFKIKNGDICLFCGPNGAGKTTTIKAIFKELEFKEGEITYNNKKLLSSSLKDFAFFPDSNNIPLSLTVKDYIQYIGTIYDIKKTTLKEKTEFLIKFFNLEEHKNKKLGELSAGWKKRAIFAGVLVNEPKYVFMDEPTANLDIASQEYFVQVVKKLNEKGVTFFITTHQIEDFSKINNHLIVINEGNILYDQYINPNKQNSKDIYLEHIKNTETNNDLLEKIYTEK